MQVVNLAHAQENPNLLITKQRPIKQKKREKKHMKQLGAVR